MKKEIIVLMSSMLLIVSLSGCNEFIDSSNSEENKFLGIWEGIVNTGSEDIYKIKFEDDNYATWWYISGIYEYMSGSYSVSNNKLTLDGWNVLDFTYEFKNNKLYLNGFELVKHEENIVIKPNITSSEYQYKQMCQEIEYVWEFADNPSQYLKENISFSASVDDLIIDGDFTVIKVVSGLLYEDNIYIITDKEIDLEIGDQFYIWGSIRGVQSYFNEISPYMWAFFINETIDEPYDISNQSIQKLYNYLGWENPSYFEMVSFLNQDNTNNLAYSDDFTCENFTTTMIDNARSKGLIAEYVVIYQTEQEYYALDEWENASVSHVIVCFNTSDRGLYFVEPQSDEKISFNEFEQMKSNGKYPYASEDGVNPMDFHHYNIEYAHHMLCYNYSYSEEDYCEDYIFKYSWDNILGKWIFEHNDEVFIIDN